MARKKPEQKKKKILIADDDRLSLKMLQNILFGAGYSVIQATNGQEAVALAKQEHPDLAILDIAMPDLDGINAAIILKNDPQTRSIPIIFLSSLVEKEIKKEKSSLPGSSFLNKPPQKDDLLREIKEHL